MQLLTKQLEDPAWNQSFARYFESLPAWGTLYSKEIWHLDSDHMALFQEPYLVRACHTHLCPYMSLYIPMYLSDLACQASLIWLWSREHQGLPPADACDCQCDATASSCLGFAHLLGVQSPGQRYLEPFRSSQPSTPRTPHCFIPTTSGHLRRLSFAGALRPGELQLDSGRVGWSSGNRRVEAVAGRQGQVSC